MRAVGMKHLDAKIKETKLSDYYEDPRTEMRRYIPIMAHRLLDVGCAAGSFGAALKLEQSMEVWGIERSAEVAAVARERLDHVIIADVESDGMLLPECYFDCIVFNDILEHTREPWNLLKRFKKYLTGAGCIVASIPNVRYYEIMKELVIQGIWRYRDCGVLDRTHLRFFTGRTIRELFQDCGYDVLVCEGIRGEKFPWKFGLLNILVGNSLDDMRFERYACVATVKNR